MKVCSLVMMMMTMKDLRSYNERERNRNKAGSFFRIRYEVFRGHIGVSLHIIERNKWSGAEYGYESVYEL